MRITRSLRIWFGKSRDTNTPTIFHWMGDAPLFVPQIDREQEIIWETKPDVNRLKPVVAHVWFSLSLCFLLEMLGNGGKVIGIGHRYTRATIEWQ